MRRTCECGNRKADKSNTCRTCWRRQNAAAERQYQDGYVYLFRPDHPFANANGRVAEHRLVMEQALGRFLTPTEFPHHIQGIRDDNRIERLELWDRAQPSGQRVADRIAWYIEELERWGFQVIGEIPEAARRKTA